MPQPHEIGPRGPDKFTPIADSSNSVLLPGVQLDPGIGMVQVVPPDLKPIMASGYGTANDLTATLLPLGDPLPPLPPVMSLEMAPLAMPPMQGIPPMEMPMPEPPAFPETPPSPGAALPGLEPLGEPLPTSVMPYQRAWPPYVEGYQAPGFPLPSPLPPSEPVLAALPSVALPVAPFPQMPQGVLEAILPQLMQAAPMMPAAEAVLPFLPDIAPATHPELTVLPVEPAAAPLSVSMPQIEAAGAGFPSLSLPAVEAFATPALETPSPLPTPVLGEPVSASVATGWDSLAEALLGFGQHEERAQKFTDERGRLRAPQPTFADGKVLWKQVWGADE
jgi:hypothetical protein